MIDATSTLEDVAFAVCTTLERAGFRVVLTGGSAATYYAPAAYQSHDLDFVLVFNGPRAVEALAAIGFHRDGAGTFRHPGTHLSLDFVNGPVAVGEDEITQWVTVTRGTEVLHVLSPTDSVRDRLAGFLFSNDFASLAQAVAVYESRRADVDLARVEAWCRRERRPEQWALFRARVSARPA